MSETERMRMLLDEVRGLLDLAKEHTACCSPEDYNAGNCCGNLDVRLSMSDFENLQSIVDTFPVEEPTT